MMVFRRLRQNSLGSLVTALCLVVSLGSLYQSYNTASRLLTVLERQPQVVSMETSPYDAPAPTPRPLPETYHFEQPSVSVIKEEESEEEIEKDEEWALHAPVPASVTGSDRSATANQSASHFTAKIPRQAYVIKVCEKLGLKPRPLTRSDLSSIFVNDRYRVLHCMLPKVASTSWARVWLTLDGHFNVSDPSQISAKQLYGPEKAIEKLPSLDRYSDREIQQKLDTYSTLVFVRNPAERVLSAFRNKLENPNSSFRRTFGRRIVHGFRARPSKMALERGHDVTFREFVEYVVDPARGEPLNAHWNVMSEACHACSVHYDFVGKNENLQEEAAQALALVGVRHVSFPSRSKFYKHRKSSSVVNRYFSILSPSLLRRFYTMFTADFLLFNYTMPTVTPVAGV